MTADVTEIGLGELLRLPQVQVQVRAEQIGPGRQGGPLLVVIGISLIGSALWGWAEDTLGWSVFGLTALGAALSMTGVGLAAHTQRDQQPADSTLSSRPAAKVFAPSVVRNASTAARSWPPRPLADDSYRPAPEAFPIGRTSPPAPGADHSRHAMLPPNIAEDAVKGVRAEALSGYR